MVTIENTPNGKNYYSRNLRGIVDYARDISPVISLHIFKELDGRGHVSIVFKDGATVDTYFADYNVLKKWCENRIKKTAGFALANYSYQ